MFRRKKKGKDDVKKTYRSWASVAPILDASCTKTDLVARRRRATSTPPLPAHIYVSACMLKAFGSVSVLMWE
jgi:hypothetical protein